jgi:hypothetical protein
MAGALGAHTGSYVFSDLLIHVETDLIGQLLCEPITTEECLEPHPQLSEPCH